MFVSELPDGSLAGYVAVSRIENRNGSECWIHDLEATGEAVELMARARGQARQWGFDEVTATVGNPKLVQVLLRSGWEINQFVLVGRI